MASRVLVRQVAKIAEVVAAMANSWIGPKQSAGEFIKQWIPPLHEYFFGDLR
jgi:hypothetical protein